MKITILGDGAWGTALALVALQNENDVTLWGAFPEYLEKMRKTRRNENFLPDIPLPETLRLEDKLDHALNDAELVIGAVPVQYLRGVLERDEMRAFPTDAVYVNVGKGIELGTHLRPGQIVAEKLGDIAYTALSGPSHAEEVAQRVPTAVVVASTDRKSVV